MAIIHDPIRIAAGQSVPSLGVLLGTRVSSDVFESVNNYGHRSFFGSDFDHMTQEFFNRYVKPMDELNLDLSRTIANIMNPDRIRILDTIDDFKMIPMSMEMPILMFEPVRKLFMEGRVDGFGYDPSTLPEEDVHGRLLDNFTCEDVRGSSDEDGYYPITATLRSDDPDLTDDELWSIRKTRSYIRNLLEETDRDPTCIELTRG